MNIIQYIMIGVIIALGTTCGILYTQNRAIKIENNNLIIDLSNSSAMLSLQSAEIEKQKLDIAKYKKERININNQIKNKYNNVNTDIAHKTCEAELNTMKELLKVFNK